MSDDYLVEHSKASTPLSVEELEGLIPSYITLRSELNEAEQANILEAEEWAFKQKRDVLTEKYLNDLHKRMSGAGLEMGRTAPPHGQEYRCR
jgi:hypothetical protein